MNYKYPLSVYKAAVDTVPAYKNFLIEKCGGKIPEVTSIEDFYNLPFIDKSSYIQAYPIEDLCLNGTLHGKHLISTSSGSSGKYQYWPIRPETEKEYAAMVYNELNETCKISQKSTLVILGLMMGGNLSGALFAYALRAAAIENENFTLMTPGLDEQATIEFIKQFSPKYEQTIIYSYPATAKNIIESAAEQGIEIKKHNILLKLIGDSYSEQFRDNINELLGYPYGYLESVSAGYGATDFRAVGKENHLCTAIRRLLYENSRIKEVIGVDDVPTICQLNINSVFVEAVEEELIITQKNAIPLVRYKSNDSGGIILFNDMIERLKSYSLDPFKKLKEFGLNSDNISENPFVFVTGRRDGLVFNGAKIKTENIKAVFEKNPYLAERVTGEFQIKKIVDNEEQYIELSIIPKPGTENLNKDEIAITFASDLAKIQKGLYAKLFEADRQKVLPRIRFVKRQDIETLSGFKIKYLG